KISENTIRNCWRTTKIISKTSELKESESDNELQDKTTNNNVVVALLLKDLSAETDLVAQELSNNIEEYIQIIDQPAMTEDILIDKDIIEIAVEVLEKVIRYQKDLNIEKEFDENGLIMLQKKLKEWQYEKDKSKKQTSILFFFNNP
ncbi:18263_t:CDS:2, partial [Racocetra persica]